MSELKKINLSQLSGTYEPIPDGEYEVQLTNLEPGTSSKSNPMLTATYKIITGPHRNSEIMQWYSLNVTTKDNGKISCFGVSKMVAILAAIGIPKESYENDIPLDPVAAGRFFQKYVKGKRMEVFVTTIARKDDPSKTSTDMKVFGLVGGNVDNSDEIEEDEE